MRRLSNDRVRFNDQEDYYHIIDIIARSYGTLPSEIKKLDWDDLLFCLQCVRAHSTRVSRSMRKNKKGSIQGTISIEELSNLIG